MSTARNIWVGLWVVLFIVVACSWYYSNQGVKDNEKILKVQLSVTECTTDDTPIECRARQDKREKEEGIARIAEVDCRVRLALAGLPALPPTQKCEMP